MMERAPPAHDSRTVDLVDRVHFALKAAFVGACLGGGVALASGGSLVVQIAQAGTITVVVGGILYWMLLALASRYTDASGQYRIAHSSTVTNRTQRAQYPSDKTEPVGER